MFSLELFPSSGLARLGHIDGHVGCGQAVLDLCVGDGAVLLS